MNQQINRSYLLSTSNSNLKIEEAFKGDKLGRINLGDRLTGYLDRLRAGAVLAIDAQWGDGKTWFGRNWAKQLETEHKVIFIDAFNQDYIEDPFILIAAELAQALDDGQENTRELREKATGVIKAILPVGTKALINIVGRLTLGASDISEDIKDAVEAANETAADVTSKWIEDKFKNHEEEKASLQHFKIALETIAQAQDKPIVIFIDELDRCRPTFAVKLIERIKHFFDVPNVVFVLLINRKQLDVVV
ncbi:MAG: KAP family P-loop NTPase fold protein [Methylobacter sp.]